MDALGRRRLAGRCRLRPLTAVRGHSRRHSLAFIRGFAGNEIDELVELMDTCGLWCVRSQIV